MNDQELRMAVECQLLNAGNREGLFADALKKFADLIRADEREECAKVCVPILRTARILQNSSEQGAKHDLLFFTC